MRILVCCKIVPEDQDIQINQSDHTLLFDKAALKISPYDLNAIEAGAALARALPGSTLTGLSAGSRARLDNPRLRKDMLSRGPDALALVVDDACDAMPPQATARVLARAAREAGFDLILCGEGSGDLYAQQVGTLLGEYLDVPNINAVNGITPGEGCLTVTRALEGETETLEVPLPAVLSVTSDINLPPVPTMKNILGAGKKPATALAVDADPGPLGAQTVSVLAPEGPARKQDIVEGDSDEAIAAFIEKIRKELADA